MHAIGDNTKIPVNLIKEVEDQWEEISKAMQIQCRKAKWRFNTVDGLVDKIFDNPEDMLSECTLIFLKSLHLYDASKMSLVDWARYTAHQRLISLYIKYYMRKGRTNIYSRSIDGMASYDDDLGDLKLERYIVEKNDLTDESLMEEDVAYFLTLCRLPTHYKYILGLRLKGIMLKDMSAIVGKSRKYCDNILSRCYDHIRANPYLLPKLKIMLYQYKSIRDAKQNTIYIK